MSRRSIFFSLLFGVGLFVIARMEYYPQSGMFAAMGMSGPRANSGRRCSGISIWHLLRRDIPPSEICFGESVFIPPAVSSNQSVAVDPWTHEVKHAQTAWMLGDSVEWRWKRDSLLTSLAKLGGHLVSCNTIPPFRLLANAYYWKFPGFYLKVRADGVSSMIGPSPRWVVSMEGFPHMPYECLNRPITEP